MRSPALSHALREHVNVKSPAPAHVRAERGVGAEDAAVRFLIGKGLRILDRNVRCRFGEVDVVARDGEYLVFAEVRLRSHARFGGAAESVDSHKQRRICATAHWYLARHPRFANTPCRFDVLAITAVDGDIQWIRDAFRLDG